MVQNWGTLTRAFVKEYYSPGKTQSLHNKIANFAQYPMETILEAFVDAKISTSRQAHSKLNKLAKHACRIRSMLVNFPETDKG
jgi:hypothetical protein